MEISSRLGFALGLGPARGGVFWVAKPDPEIAGCRRARASGRHTESPEVAATHFWAPTWAWRPTSLATTWAGGPFPCRRVLPFRVEAADSVRGPQHCVKFRAACNSLRGFGLLRQERWFPQKQRRGSRCATSGRVAVSRRRLRGFAQRDCFMTRQSEFCET